MSNIRCIIVEDEPLAAKLLMEYIQQVPSLELAGKFKDAPSAMEYLLGHSIDLMFLDIHLPKMKGIAFLKALPHPPLVIMTTAYHHYAVEGFNLNVVDYLLKPYDIHRFMVAVNKANNILSQKNVHGDPEYIFVNVKKKKVKIRYSEILYVESQREYVKIVTQEKEYYSKITTHEIEKQLPKHQFKRIHRSFIVSVQRIRSFTNEMVELDGVSIPIGRGYKDVVKQF